ncbi:MAG TPA: serine/threonine-protein kinase [Candidatus Eisenbacteria bacterium]|nr:serine/threonine-protein kinase [Candidatus Eisenbacteria bacterium]
MPRIGEVLADRYRIEGVLGAGGMAAVYRATDLRLAREVAVKVLAPNLAADPLFAARFDREARALAAVAHPNIVAVFDVEPGDSATGHEPFYVMELCNGGTLGDRLESHGPLQPAELVPIVEAVAEGLTALHDRGLVHRDVKPHNILFQDDRAKLGDFGLARSERAMETTPLTVPGATVGTLPYLAPELLAGNAPTPASDVYALGVTIFQALTGRYPKPAGSMHDVFEHRHRAPSTVSSIVPALEQAFDAPIGGALAEDPAERPSAVALADSLDAALDGRTPIGLLAGTAAGGEAESPIAVDPNAATVVRAPATMASGRASPNPDAMWPSRVAAPRLEPDSTGGVIERRAAVERARGNRFLVPTGILLAALGLAAIVAFGGLLGGIGGSGAPGESQASNAPAESESPSSPTENPTAAGSTTDAAEPALAALQDVIAAIRAAQGGKDSLTGRDVSELEGLAAAVGDALSSGDFERARSATEALASRADKLAKDLDEARKAGLLNAVAALAEAIPA